MKAGASVDDRPRVVLVVVLPGQPLALDVRLEPVRAQPRRTTACASSSSKKIALTGAILPAPG